MGSGQNNIMGSRGGVRGKGAGKMWRSLRRDLQGGVERKLPVLCVFKDSCVAG